LDVVRFNVNKIIAYMLLIKLTTEKNAQSFYDYRTLRIRRESKPFNEKCTKALYRYAK